MTDKELRKLSRSELLELLIDQMEENEKLRKQLEEATAKLQDRHIILKKAGSIANAALELNKVFEAADAAARQYVESIRYLVDEQTKRQADRQAAADKHPVENVSYVRKNEESNRAKGKVESDTGRKEAVSELKKTSPKDGAANS